MSCAGKPQMERGKGDGSSEYANEGSCAHAVAALCLAEGVPIDSFVGTSVEIGPDTYYVFREDMVEATQVYVDAVLARMQEYRLAGAASVNLMVEQRVPIDHLTGETGAEGTADALIVVTWPDRSALLDVGDLKFGKGVEVEVVENKQLMIYALGALELLSGLTEFARVRLTIYQPRIKKTPSDWELPVAELLLFGGAVKVTAERALRIYTLNAVTSDDLAPTVKGCRWCTAKAFCPALSETVLSVIGVDSYDEIAPVTPSQSDPVPLGSKRDLEGQAPEVLAEKMSACDLIEDWIRSVRAAVESRLILGTPVPGFKLVQGRMGNRAWTDKDAVEAFMKKKVRLHTEQMYHRTLISPTDAEKLAGSKEIGPKQWEQLVALITRAPGAIHVAPESDRRPAVSSQLSAAAYE